MYLKQEGAFDEAVKGVDAIEHTASPFHMNADDPDGTLRRINALDLYSPVLRTYQSRSQWYSWDSEKCSQVWVGTSSSFEGVRC